VYCNVCGTANVEHARFCVHCGTTIGQPSVVVPPAQSGMPGAAPAPAILAPAAYPPTGAAIPQTSGKAVASMVMGLANAMFFFLFFPLAIAAVVVGHMARREIQTSGGRLKGDGMALTGLITGYGSLALVAVIVLAAVAIASRAGGGSESRVLGDVRAYMTAAVTYEAQFAKGYPPSLAAMGPGDGSERGANLIGQALAKGERHGYRYTYTPLDHNGDGYYEAFTLTADPSGFSSLSGRHFFLDQTGVIRVERDHMATADSPELY